MDKNKFAVYKIANRYSLSVFFRFCDQMQRERSSVSDELRHLAGLMCDIVLSRLRRDNREASESIYLEIGQYWEKQEPIHDDDDLGGTGEG